MQIALVPKFHRQWIPFIKWLLAHIQRVRIFLSHSFRERKIWCDPLWFHRNGKWGPERLTRQAKPPIPNDWELSLGRLSLHPLMSPEMGTRKIAAQCVQAPQSLWLAGIGLGFCPSLLQVAMSLEDLGNGRTSYHFLLHFLLWQNRLESTLALYYIRYEYSYFIFF